MKKLFFFLILSLSSFFIKAQQVYYDFEGIRNFNFGLCTGNLDTNHSNVNPNNVNSSLSCAKYIRDTSTYDFIKFYPYNKLIDVTSYTNTVSGTPKIKMKIFTTAPIGTIVDIQLGIKSIDNYPAGIHSEYRTYTTKQNEWEELVFDFLQLTPGSMVNSDTINKIVLLLHPNSSDRDTMYFDDISGPELVSPQFVRDSESAYEIQLSQNYPNPCSTQTNINFYIPENGNTQLSIYSSIGEHLKTYHLNHLISGNYHYTINTEELSSGMYYYVLTTSFHKKIKPMIVVKD